MKLLEKVKSLLSGRAASLLIGIAIGVLLHYMFYRIFLPVQPFIYVAF